MVIRDTRKKPDSLSSGSGACGASSAGNGTLSVSATNVTANPDGCWMDDSAFDSDVSDDGTPGVANPLPASPTGVVDDDEVSNSTDSAVTASGGIVLESGGFSAQAAGPTDDSGIATS